MATILNEIAAGQYLGGMSRSFMRQRRCAGTGPQFLKIGKSVRYSTEALDTWLEQNIRQNTIRFPTNIATPRAVNSRTVKTSKNRKKR
jgi:predicted DNA-binding transcriptional regulator AlpA